MFVALAVPLIIYTSLECGLKPLRLQICGGRDMNGLTVSDMDNPVILRQKGIKALAEALGPIGMARFFQQYGLGAGDYTAERETLLAGITMEDFERWQKERKDRP